VRDMQWQHVHKLHIMRCWRHVHRECWHVHVDVHSWHVSERRTASDLSQLQCYVPHVPWQ